MAKAALHGPITTGRCCCSRRASRCCSAPTSCAGGWMAGVGVEYAFTDRWSAKIEYNHMDLGTDSLRFTDQLTSNVWIDADFKQRIDIVKVGVNYRFGVNPILIR